MIRYAGGSLPANCRLALVSNDALGNFVVCTPLLKKLREIHSVSRLDYFGGKRTQELAARSDLIDAAYPLHGTAPADAVKWTLKSDNRYDIVINVEGSAWAKAFTSILCTDITLVCGPCLGPEGRSDLPYEEGPRGALWSDPRWISEDLTRRYPFLETGFISEIFCRLCYLEGPIPGYQVAADPVEIPVPDVLIATSASLQEKLWPFEKWRAVLAPLRAEGLSVGLLGARPKEQGRYWTGNELESQLIDEGLVEDLRGKFSLPQVVGALSACRTVLTLDNGILHLAVAAGAKTVGLFRYGIHRLWAPPSENLTVVTAQAGLTVADIAVPDVATAVRETLK